MNRNYGIELLRVLSMLMIVCHHILLHGGLLDFATPFSLKYWLVWLFEIFCIGAVNIYALISGFVGYCNSPKPKKLFNLWLKIVFYSIWITLLIFILFPGAVTWQSIINIILPISTNQYWYLSAYFGLFLLMPVLNIAIQQLPQNVLRNSLVSIFILMCLIQTVIRKDPYGLGNGYSMIWLAILYLAGGYTSKYVKIRSSKKCIMCFVITLFLTFISKIFLEYGTLYIFGTAKGGNLLISYLSPTVIIAALCILLSAANWNLPLWCIKYIKFFSYSSIAVYIIHENNFIRAFVIKDQMTFLLDLNPVVMLLSIVIICVTIYLVCTFIDHIGKALFSGLKNILAILFKSCQI